MLGGAALLADGIITISITSAIEGLKNIQLHDITTRNDCNHRTGHSLSLFFMQQFGTASIGKMFGPVMLVWFSMLAILGFSYNGRSVHL